MSTTTDIHTLHQRASDALHEGNTETAIELYSKIVELNPTDEAALSQLMDIYNETDKFKYYLARANVNIAQGKLEHAINDTKKAINLDPQALDANIKLARLYLISKKNLKAIDQFNRVLEIESKEASSYVELINLYIAENSLQSAIGIGVRAMDVFEGNEFFANILAKLYLSDDNYEKALSVVKDEMLEARILLQKGDNALAKEKLDKINPQKLPNEGKQTYFLHLAQYFYNEKKHQEAFDAIDKYVEFKEPDPVSFQMRALVCEDKGDKFGAEFNWGFCNKTRGKLEEAIMHFVNAYRLDPKNKDVIYELINLYEKTGDKFVAIEYWQKLYELDGDEQAKQVLGEFYYSQGDMQLARKYGRVVQSKDSETLEEDEGLINKILKLFGK